MKLRKFITTFLFVMFVIGMLSSVSRAAEENIASGVIDEEYGQITWVIDSEGHLTITGKGDFKPADDQAWYTGAPWSDYYENILSAEINVTGMTDASMLFIGCSYMKELDVSGLDTSQVKNMSSMFSNCRQLTELDVSHFVTDKVTDMSDMFSSCESLRRLDLSGFDTSNVTNMAGMFDCCKSLRELDLSSFETDNCTNMRLMFHECESLPGLDLSHFDTSKVTTTYSMFMRCINLQSLDLSGWDTGELTDMEQMFVHCSKLRTLDLSSFDVRNTYVGSCIFDNCYLLKSIKIPAYWPYSVNLPNMFRYITWETEDGTEVTTVPSGLETGITLTNHKQSRASGDIDEEYGKIHWELDMFGHLTLDGTGDYTDGNYWDAPWLEWMEYITTIEVNVTGMTDATELFAGYENLEAVYLDNFDSSKVVSMSFMFAGCPKLYTLDLRKLNTENVETMEGMFVANTNLEILKLDGWDVSKVRIMNGMFYQCQSLEMLDLSGFDLGSVEEAEMMFGECDNLKILKTPVNCSANIELPLKAPMESWGNEDDTTFTILPQDENESMTLFRDWVIAGGTVDDEYGQFFWCIDRKGKLYVEGSGDWRDPYAISDTSLSERVAPWYEKREEILTAEINLTNTVSIAYMFYDCVNIESIDLSNFDTSSLEMMDRAFYNCNWLRELDLTNLDTSKVTDMGGLFYECWSLEELDLSNFDTSNVWNMAEMFYGCGLKILDLRNFDMSNVEVADDMLDYVFPATIIYTPKNCYLEIYLPYGGDTSEDWYMPDGTEVYSLPMYLEESIVLLEDMRGAGSIDEEYGRINWMISEDGHLVVEGTGDYHLPLNMETENFEEVMPPWYPAHGNILTAEINVTGMTDASWMFYECYNLEAVDLTNFETKNLKSTMGMFALCENLTELDVSNFDTGNVVNMEGMFASCIGLTSLDVSGFDTSNVENMGSMFCNCVELTELDISGFNTSKIRKMDYMFAGCLNLKSLDLSGFDMSNVTVAENVIDMFAECPSMEQIESPLKCSFEIALPTASDEDIWYRSDSTEITVLPLELKKSITLMKNQIPEETYPEKPEEEPKPPVTETFTDIKSGEWYIDAVQYVFDNGIMGGNKGVFNPNGNISREQVIATLYNMENSPKVDNYAAVNALKDLKAGQWYTDAICWAYNLGVAQGNASTKMFGIGTPITREQLATMLYNYAAKKEYDTETRKDYSALKGAKDVSSYAVEVMRWAYGTGLIGGNNNLNPKGYTTRAQMASILMNFRQKNNI